MIPSKSTYNEHLLHWIWKNGYLAGKSLQTTGGKKIHLYDSGKHNPTDGPDFTNAHISIGRLSFYGDIEIHWSPQDWFNHGHHTDKNYNCVVLHVIFDDENLKPATRADGTPIPTLCIKRFLEKPLLHFFEQYRQPSGLACSGSISFISPEVFSRQIEKAHREYFEQKVNDLLQFYDSALPLSEAWQNLLIIALFDGLGIAHNREPMQKLARALLRQFSSFTNTQQLISFALKEAGIDPKNKTDTYHWKRKGSRPANHPRHRIIQGCELLWAIKKQDFKMWLRTDIHQSFKECRQQIYAKPGLGKARANILFGTVWIPALYILADLLKAHKRTSAAYDAWLHYRTSLPASISKPFKSMGIPASSYRKKLGTVHQLRAYCRPHRCEQCKVFNHVISS